MQCFAAASVAIVLGRRPAIGVPVAIALVVAPVLADTIARLGSPTIILQTIYDLVGLSVAAGSLYAAPQLVRVMTELRATRAALAEAAVGAERLRVSRELHDLLGQSLSAVSLKGDLALALLDRGPARARSEVEGVAEVARDALWGLRTIARDEHPVSLRSELADAAELLQAAGVSAEMLRRTCR